MNKKFLRTLFVPGLCVLATAIPQLSLASGGESEWQEYLKLKNTKLKFHIYKSEGENRREHAELTRRKWARLDAAANLGHPKAQQEEIKVSYKRPEDMKKWQDMYNNNPRNPNYNPEKAQEERKREDMRLQLELEQARIRRLELERQPQQPRARQQAPQPQANNYERNLRIVGAAIDTFDAGVNLYNDFQTGNNSGGY
jgi:hypothetical protein